MTFETIDVAVDVTTLCTPPMSFAMRDCTSPVRVRVKKASESRCRCAYTDARRSCMTSWPMRLESQVCPTPMTPVTIGIATMPATSRSSWCVSILSPFANTPSSRSRSRNGGIIESAAVSAISASSHARLRR